MTPQAERHSVPPSRHRAAAVTLVAPLNRFFRSKAPLVPTIAATRSATFTPPVTNSRNC